jgi:MFS family permease
MAGATIAPSLPAMRQFFSEVPNADYLVRLVLTAPALLIAIGAPFVGVLIDKLGRKPLLIAALLVYGLAGSSGLWFSTLELILVERAFLGVSVAGVMITATALIADYYTGPARGQFLGLQSAFMALGGVTFLSVGGFLADLKWRMPFEIYLVALVLILCVLLLLPEPPRANSSSTPPGLLQEEGPPPFPIPLVTLTYGIALLTQIVFYLIPVQLPFYLKSLFNAGASQSGLAIAFCILFSAISSLAYQRIKLRLSFISIYGVAFANMALGCGLIYLAQNYPVVMAGLAIAGLGLGLLMPNMNFCLTSITPSSVRGQVLAGLTTSFFLGQFLSPLISQPISQAIGLGPTYGLAGIAMALMTLAALITLLRWKG